MSKLSALQQLVISIHALREESDVVDAAHLVAVIISIHALREESDGVMVSNTYWRAYFNPRSP